MEKVGAVLRAARQEKGITLREVEEVTKIRLRYLEALEEGDYDQIPGRVYAIGFVRNYARFLGLDDRALIRQFKEEYPAEENNNRAGEINLAPTGLTAGKWQRWLLVVAALLTLWGANWLYNSFIRPIEKLPPQQPPATEPAPVNPEPPPSATQPPPPPIPPRAESVEVRLEATGNCWVGVTIDGKDDFSGTLKAGESKVFQGQEKITITLGSAGAMNVTVNGQAQPSLGRVGDVITFTATKDSVQVQIINPR